MAPPGRREPSHSGRRRRVAESADFVAAPHIERSSRQEDLEESGRATCAGIITNTSPPLRFNKAWSQPHHVGSTRAEDIRGGLTLLYEIRSLTMGGCTAYGSPQHVSEIMLEVRNKACCFIIAYMTSYNCKSTPVVSLMWYNFMTFERCTLSFIPWCTKLRYPKVQIVLLDIR